ncbi:hybrid sensor histidine kinase/response regulator [Azohydromonas caseinilytica]|uniref:histidine kinase n=1 Tax=Azohydromonas caseinilytica TaxID=2728836 RepID=A0A848FA52_9BURK|nr:ATP-binding protein [Azohydromonas caseinilytica]NML15736.1 response regulator [Azohydromonas caseinilytica]
MSRTHSSGHLLALQRCAALVCSSASFEQLAANVLQSCLPLLGDFGFFDVDLGTEVVRTARAHEDPATEALLRPTRWAHQERDDGMNLCALSSGVPAVHPDIDDAWYRRVARGDEAHLAALRGLAFGSMVSVPLRFSGELVGALTLFMGRSGRRHGAQDVALAQDIADLVAPALANVRLLAAERRARLAAESAQRRMQLLAAASSELSQTLDTPATLRTIARLLVPAVVDWCRIDLVDAQGQPSVALVHHQDAGLAARAEAHSRRWRASATVPGSVDWTIRHAKPQRGSVTPENIRLITDPDFAELVRILGVHDSLMVPLVARGRTLGALVVLQAESGRRFDDADMTMLTQLGDRAALALDNARLFAQAEEARRQAERASRAKDEFLAMLGHELRNPLHPIVTALTLLDKPEPRAHELARQVIGRQVRHLTRLVDDLLDVARIAEGRVTLALEPVDLAALLADAMETVQPAVRDKRLSCRLELPAAPVHVRGDRTRLLQVLTNLLVNACKFTDAGGTVTASLASDGGEVQLCVADTGMGIAPALLPQVFEPFVQGAQAAARTQGGLGLGLAIARSLVTLHGGRISAHSEGEGRGSRFCITLPQLAAAAPPAAAAPGPSARSAGAARVLVIDDSEDVRETMGEILRGQGYEVRCAADGVEGLDIARDFAPDLALCDIGMPRLDGYQVARRWRSDPVLGAAGLIAVTGYGRAPDQALAREAGFDHHLTKPVDSQALLELVASLIEAVRRRRSGAPTAAA